VLAALLDATPKRFSEIKAETGLSDPWLAKTLRKLSRSGQVVFDGKRYTVGRKDNRLVRLVEKAAIYSHFLMGKAVRAAGELARNPQVLAVVLFGTMARLETNPESDIDLLIVTSEESEGVRRRVIDLEVEYNVPIESVVTSLEEFKRTLTVEPNLIFGILAGYIVLVDKDEEVKRLLSEKERQVEALYTIDREAMMWLRR
jgi:predicted nucleotidyltransferase